MDGYDYLLSRPGTISGGIAGLKTLLDERDLRENTEAAQLTNQNVATAIAAGRRKRTLDKVRSLLSEEALSDPELDSKIDAGQTSVDRGKLYASRQAAENAWRQANLKDATDVARSGYIDYVDNWKDQVAQQANDEYRAAFDREKAAGNAALAQYGEWQDDPQLRAAVDAAVTTKLEGQRKKRDDAIALVNKLANEAKMAGGKVTQKFLDAQKRMNEERQAYNDLAASSDRMKGTGSTFAQAQKTIEKGISDKAQAILEQSLVANPFPDQIDPREDAGFAAQAIRQRMPDILRAAQYDPVGAKALLDQAAKEEQLGSKSEDAYDSILKARMRSDASLLMSRMRAQSDYDRNQQNAAFQSAKLQLARDALGAKVAMNNAMNATRRWVAERGANSAEARASMNSLVGLTLGFLQNNVAYQKDPDLRAMVTQAQQMVSGYHNAAQAASMLTEQGANDLGTVLVGGGYVDRSMAPRMVQGAATPTMFGFGKPKAGALEFQQSDEPQILTPEYITKGAKRAPAKAKKSALQEALDKLKK